MPLAQKIARVPVVARANEELFDTGGGVDGGSVDSRAISPTLSMTPAVGGVSLGDSEPVTRTILDGKNTDHRRIFPD